MTIPFICVAIAFALVYVTKIPVGVAMAKHQAGYDNRNPRDQQAQLQGWGRRATAAHANTIEAFPGFAAGVLIAHVGGADPAWSAWLAIAFVVARVIYPALYLADIHWARSTIWGVGCVASFALMVLPALA
jgi:uncharacterized MAPEG superfamily protein